MGGQFVDIFGRDIQVAKGTRKRGLPKPWGTEKHSKTMRGVFKIIVFLETKEKTGGQNGGHNESI